MKQSILILLCLLTIAGCTKNNVPDGLPELVSVTLTFTQDGVPLTGATVSLIDPNGGVPFVVGGTTNAKGNVVLHTHGRHKGAPLAKFKIRIEKTESDPRPIPPDVGTPEFEAYRKEMESLPPQKMYSLVEKQYTQVETTPLELDITGPLTRTFDIGKAVKDVLE